MKTNVQKKKAVVNYLLKSKTKKITKSQYASAAKKFDVSKKQAELAMVNFLNFGKVDMRFSKANNIGKEKNLSIANKMPDSAIAKADKVEGLPYRNISDKEMCMYLHEFLFASTERIIDYLIRNNIRAYDWYTFHKNFVITGKIGNKKILDFTQYKKLDVRAVLLYARRVTREKASGRAGKNFNQLTNYRIWRGPRMEKFNLTERKQIVRAAHIVEMYL